MKKVLLVLAIVAVYGFSISSVSAKSVVVDEVTVTIVADENVKAEKEKPAAKKAEAKGAACGEKAEVKSEAKVGCGEAKKADCSTAAKSSCCGGEKKADGGK